MHGKIDKRWPLTQSVPEETHGMLLDTGLCVEPHLVENSALDAPEMANNPDLTHEIVRDRYTP